MSLEGLEKTVIGTALGPIPLWAPPGSLQGERPVVLTITGSWAKHDTMSLTPKIVGPWGWDAVLMHLPGNDTPELAETSVAAWARAVEELLERAFAGRIVVLLGLSIGALVALGVRSPRVRRVLALEPPLAMGKIWPMADGLKQRLKQVPADAVFIRNVFGFTDKGLSDLDYRHLIDGSGPPVEVIAGGVPLMPKRAVDRYPSLLDEAERDWLATRPEVTLHVAPNCGHNIHSFAGPFLRDVLLAVLAKALAPTAVWPWQVDGVLAAAVPLSARRILYVGPRGEAFAAACAARNPPAEVATEASGGTFDVVAVEDAAGWTTAQLAQAVAADGWMIGRLPADHGLTEFAPGAGVARAHKGVAPDRLRLEIGVFAPRLMDIRTRLPAQALTPEPDLQVIYKEAPFDLRPAPVDQPKVLLLQRPAGSDPAVWLRSLAQSIAGGWVVAMEFDDHPELIARMHGGHVDWSRFSAVHGIQTSTPRLAAAFGAHNPEVALFPNAVFDLPPFTQAPRPARVFYGGVLRGPFAVEVATSLAPAIAAFPDTEFVVAGDRAVFDALPAPRKVFHDYMTYGAYLELMGTCTISLSPLSAAPLVDTKSDAKFLDAARAGALTIGSPTVYADTIADGVNGLIAREVEDWPRLLAKALAEPAWTRELARRAWEEVRDHRMFAHQLEARKSWYWSLWSRREALNRALMDRTPGLEAAVKALA